MSFIIIAGYISNVRYESEEKWLKVSDNTLLRTSGTERRGNRRKQIQLRNKELHTIIIVNLIT